MHVLEHALIAFSIACIVSIIGSLLVAIAMGQFHD